MRFASQALVVLALASTTAPLAIGCGHGQVRETMVAPEGADAEQRAYELGYRYGGRDRDREIPAAYTRHSDAYDAAGESQFKSGYGDGYSRIANRYGGPGASAWYTNSDEPQDDDE